MSVFLHLFHLFKCFDLALEVTVCVKFQYWFKKLERDLGEGCGCGSVEAFGWFGWSYGDLGCSQVK